MSCSGVDWRATCMREPRGSAEIPQYRLDRLAFVRGQRRLGRDRIADLITLDGETGLDAGGEVIAGERLIDPPQPALQRHRLVPALSPANLVERHALPPH